MNILELQAAISLKEAEFERLKDYCEDLPFLKGREDQVMTIVEKSSEIKAQIEKLRKLVDIEINKLLETE